MRARLSLLLASLLSETNAIGGVVQEKNAVDDLPRTDFSHQLRGVRGLAIALRVEKGNIGSVTPRKANAHADLNRDRRTRSFQTNGFVPLSLGPSFQRTFSDADLLRGFKLNIADGESPFKQAVFEGNIIDIPFTTSYSQAEVIESQVNLIDMMEISGRLSVSYGPLISGEGGGKFLKSFVVSTHQVTVVFRTRYVAFAKGVDAKTIKPSEGLVQIVANQDEMAEKFGTKFVEQIVYGAQLDVYYTISSTEQIDMEEIEAELKGKIGFGPLSIDFEAKFLKQNGSSQSQLQLSIDAKSSGVFFPVPSNPSFDEVNDLIEAFNDKYTSLLEVVKNGEADAHVLNQMSPVGFSLSSIADFVDTLEPYELSFLDDKMGELGTVFKEALFWKSRLSNTKSELESIYGKDPRIRNDIFQPYQEQVEEAMESLDKKIEECMKYRRLPVEQLVGRTGEAAKVPEVSPTPSGGVIFRGLCGKGYIPSPLEILGETFDDMHYIGFALKNMDTNTTNAVKPWMSGTVRLDTDNSEVANAATPGDVLELVLNYLHPTFAPTTAPSTLPSINTARGPLINLALHKPAFSSSVWSSSAWSSTASMAVDGNRRGSDYDHPYFHSYEDTRPWWQVDLQGQFKVSLVVLYNRQDCCGERLQGVLVDLLDKDEDVIITRKWTGGNVRVAELPFKVEQLVRYVRVRHDRSEHLQLAEVEVYRDETSNVALHKPTSASSVRESSAPDLVVNGDRRGMEISMNFFHTNRKSDAQWWQVDLQNEYDIDRVLLYNRQDCCSDRLHRVLVDLLDGDKDVIATKRWTGGGVKMAELTFDEEEPARYVRVRHDRDVYLQLAEVEVYSKIRPAD